MLMYIVQETATIPQPWAYALLMTYMYKLTAVVAGSSCLVYCINENLMGKFFAFLTDFVHSMEFFLCKNL